VVDTESWMWTRRICRFLSAPFVAPIARGIARATERDVENLARGSDWGMQGRDRDPHGSTAQAPHGILPLIHRFLTGSTAMSITPRIRPCLWFNDQGEEAARFYTGIFPNSRIVTVTRFSDAGQEIHGRPAGSVMTVRFELDGQTFTALNGGPQFVFSEAVSFEVHCADQAEIDYYWERLGEGGDPGAQQCGWLKDRFGVSWQVVPANIEALFTDPDAPGTRRAMDAMLQMKKLDIAALQDAYEGA
jgi:predicted 3-demethylubiquinone-9 3-methyltransferase (glyoxalase superfamily)